MRLSVVLDFSFLEKLHYSKAIYILITCVTKIISEKSYLLGLYCEICSDYPI